MNDIIFILFSYFSFFSFKKKKRLLLFKIILWDDSQVQYDVFAVLDIIILG